MAPNIGLCSKGVGMFVDVKDDINKIAKHMDAMGKKQLPYALKQTLNDLAVGAQRHICAKIPSIFDNRINWWSPKVKTGIKVSFAAKDNLVASVYTKAHFAHIQEEGGTKKAYHGGNLAVPTEHIPKGLRSSKGLQRSQGDRTVFRLGRGIYKRVSNQQLKKLYSLTPQAKIKPRFGFKQMAISSFNKDFDRVFTKWFDYALRTAR
jgi:hypothetical protein